MSHDTPGSAEHPTGTITFFAPAERAPLACLEEEIRQSQASPLVRVLLQAVDGFLLVVNPQRQIVAASPNVLPGSGEDSADARLGMRPGELLGCTHLSEAPGGCGTGRQCAECGAILSILDCLREGGPAVHECRMTVRKNGRTEAREFRAHASPLRLGPHKLTAVILRDISAEKRREVLERVFFHDILNTLGGLAGWSKLLGHLTGDQAREAAGRIAHLCDRLTQEVQDQRALLQAEQGELLVTKIETAPPAIFTTLQAVFAGHEACLDRRLAIAPAPDERIATDPALLLRVLTNMVKNALEATPVGGTVRVWYERREGRPGFSVWNTGAIPETVAHQLFQRSFSTKAERGRGLGTYSMKLFGERYLGGSVSFDSDAESGTCFQILLPPDPPVSSRAECSLQG
ncbi:MAG: HAMP domain-containing sensor histidine kinase [Candidatus Methylomirabilota bacterium]